MRLLYIAMWNWADDHGRGTANVKELAAFAFPHDDDPCAPTSAELPCLLTEVADRFSVVFYECDGRRYYAIPSWERHQRNERRAQSKYPAPDEGKPFNPDPSDQRKRNGHRVLHGTSVANHGSSVHVDGSSGTGTGEQGNRGSKDLAAADATPEPPAAPAAPPVDDDFTEFWAAYPRKEKKPAALKAYRALRKKHTTHTTVMDGLKKHTTVWTQAGTERQYIPHPATWLNNEAFNDDIGPTSLTVVPALKTSFDEIRADADAEYAGRLINRWYVEPAQPPSDTTPVHDWTRARALEFIDRHADAIRHALTPERRTG
ncbi:MULTISPECIES: hypothetical protein [Pseudonocardia]|uniref:hypothetical protein n=1 Tax=Pseudonocardia TaxID=1847 RepID=UPI000F76D91A|nr:MULTISPECIES: hypothetical protein [Pseudonocardia]